MLSKKFENLSSLMSRFSGHFFESIFPEMQLIQDKEHLGKDALEEVAAEARHETGEVLKFFREISGSEIAPHAGGFRGSLPALAVTPPVAIGSVAPWQRASQLARAVREQWGFGKNPILNKQLAALVG